MSTRRRFLRWHAPMGFSLTMALLVALGVVGLAGCTTGPWPDTAEYERLQDLGFAAMATTLGDHAVVHEAVPLYLRHEPRRTDGAMSPQDPVAWQFEVVRLDLHRPCDLVAIARCAAIGLTLRYDAIPNLPLDASLTQGLLWAVDGTRPTVVPNGFLAEKGEPRWVDNQGRPGAPLLLRSVTFQADRGMTIIWRYRSRDASGQASPWTTRTTVVDESGPGRAAFCAAVRRAPTQRPEVQRTVLRNDGCDPTPAVLDHLAVLDAPSGTGGR